MLLQRSLRARVAKSLFFQKDNDADIYIEDTKKGSEKLYLEILNRCLSSKYKISNAFPLGGKLEVISACEKDQSAGGRPRVYIVDGDLELITNENPKNLIRIYVLPRYCIENFLIDQDAIISLINEEDTVNQRDKIERIFDFDCWISCITHAIFELFLLYAISHKNKCGMKTVSFPVGKLVSSDDGYVDIRKIIGHRKNIKKDIL